MVCMVVCKDSYIGKRLTWDSIARNFPCSIVILDNCNIDGIDVVDGVVVEVLEDNAENHKRMSEYRRKGYRVEKTGDDYRTEICYE
jgi:hypothetical protein